MIFVHRTANCIWWNCPRNSDQFCWFCIYLWILRISYVYIYMCVFWILFWTGGNTLLIFINTLNKISDTCSFYSYERRDYALFKKIIFWWLHRERTQQEGSHLPAKDSNPWKHASYEKVSSMLTTSCSSDPSSVMLLM